jgi:hypothetical protein
LLQQQNDNINSLENSLKNQDKQLSEIDKTEKEQFEFKDQQNVKDFVERQKSR